MNLDDLRLQWAAHERKLDKLIRLNRAALRAPALGAARRALAWSAVAAALEVAFAGAFLVFLAAFMARYHAQTGLALAALVLFAATVPFIALQARHLVLVVRLDPAAPVVEMQKRVETLRIVQSNAGLWALGSGVVLWPLAATVVAKGVWGFDVSRIDAEVVAANMIAGLVGAIMVWRFRHHRALRDELAGRTLGSARARLDELARFEQDE